MTERNTIPPREFDREYNTQWRKEMEFLRDKGIEYTFAKRVGEYKIPTYKYKKTPRLFLALAEFYNQQGYEKTNMSIEKLTKQMEQGYIEVKKEDLTEPEIKLCEGLCEGVCENCASEVPEEAKAEDDTI